MFTDMGKMSGYKVVLCSPDDELHGQYTEITEQQARDILAHETEKLDGLLQLAIVVAHDANQ